MTASGGVGAVGRVVAWAALIAAGTWIVLLGGTYATATSVTARLITHVAVGGLLVGWVLVASVRPAWLPRGPFVLPALVVIAVGILSAGLSPVPRVAWEGAAGIAATGAVMLLLVRLAEESWWRQRLTMLMIAIPVLLVASAILETLVLWSMWWEATGTTGVPAVRPGNTGSWLANPNLLAAALVASIPPAAVALAARNRAGAALAACLVVGGLAIILITGSRGGAAGLVTVVAASLAVLALTRTGSLGSGGEPAEQRHLQGELFARRPANRPARAVAAIATGVLLVVVVVALAPSIMARFSSLGDIALRLDIWGDAVRIFAAHPVAGAGPGTYPLLRLQLDGGGASPVIVPHAHNLVLHVLAELGVAGVLAALAVAGGLATVIRRAAREPSSRRVALATFVGLLGFGATAMVDHALNLGSPLLIVAMPVIVLAGSHPPRPAIAPGRRGSLSRNVAMAARIAMPAALLLGGIAVIRMDTGALAGARGDAAASAGRWIDARDAYDEAVRVAPGVPLDAAGLAIANAAAGDRPDALGTLAQMAKAATGDGFSHAWIAAGWLALEADDPAAAHAAVAAARAQDPTDDVVALNAGAILESLGDTTGARDAYVAAMALNVELAASDWWRERPPGLDGDSIADAVLANFAASGRPMAEALLLGFSGRLDDARALLPGRSPGDAAYLEAVIALRESGLPAAAAILMARLEVEPQDAAAAGLMARIAAAGSDPATQARYARWAMLLGTTPAAGALNVGSRVVPVAPGGPRTTPGNYPVAIYGREGPEPYGVPGSLAIDRVALPQPITARASG